MGTFEESQSIGSAGCREVAVRIGDVETKRVELKVKGV